jgi:hypothetical protein
MTKKELDYRTIIAKLQGSIMGIIINLKLKNPTIKSEINRLEQAVKRSENQLITLNKNQ